MGMDRVHLRMSTGDETQRAPGAALLRLAGGAARQRLLARTSLVPG